MKNKINYLLTLFLLALGLGVAQQTWGDNEKLNSGLIKYKFNGGDAVQWDFKSDDKNVATRNLGILTSDFKITHMTFQFSDNFSQHASQEPSMHLAYSFDNMTTKSYCTTDNFSYDWNTWWIYKTKDWNIKSYTDASGTYTMKFYFHMWWNNGAKSDINNNGSNYIFTFTILPPAVSNFTVSGSGADLKSGSGTEQDPFIIVGGGSFTLTANCDKAHADDKSHRRYKFGDAAYSSTATKTISNVTNTEVQTIEVKACSKNETDNLSGEESTKTIYYKVEPAYTISVVSENTNKGTVDKSEVTAYQYGQAENSITATPKAGYDFAGWTKEEEGITINSPSTATTTLKSTTDGTVTAIFAYKTPGVSFDAASATYTLGGAAIKLNPTYSNRAADATYSWTSTNVTFSDDTAENPNVSSTVEGNHTVTVTVSQGGKNASQDITLIVSKFTGDDCGTCFDYQQK